MEAFRQDAVKDGIMLLSIYLIAQTALYTSSCRIRPFHVRIFNQPLVLAKRIGRQIVSPSLLGYLDYYRFPNLSASWGGPFNGQRARQEIFNALLRAIPFDLIVETGTYRGTTTEYLATASDLPVLTVEADERLYGFARRRLRRYANVTVTHQDSRRFLEELLAAKTLPAKTPLFYLDAHWGQDLPLFGELRTIFSHCPGPVIMIDDFQVPGDELYEYDDYGAGKALNGAYIEPLVEELGLARFFPATPACDESGLRRGCVVLARRGSPHREALAAMPCLREFD